MLTATPDQWRACTGCLTGHPAFILGNGPTLPDDLSCLDGYFTVGTNRILERYTPTVLLWMDADVLEHVEPLIDTETTIAIACDIHEHIPWVNTLEAIGHPERQPNCEPAHPGGLITVGNSGVSAAVWAWSLGCRPVFLLGMSATYGENGTNFYGDNPKHIDGVTLRQLTRAMLVLRHYDGIMPLEAEKIEAVTQYWCMLGGHHNPHPRAYAEHFAACHTGLYPGQRADTADRPVPAG